ncbi:GNAT family N-acetyltransferase [Neolewinella sp.]|uniref:GNAT family N-acetyltransferase n=1 Tax=Neolewinella sp. TaxID=2993543 RepID=UPI003B518CE6
MLPNPLPTLENDLVRLRLSTEADREPLFLVAGDKLMWEQHSATDRYQRPVFDALFDDGLAGRGAFTLIDRRDERIIGSTRLKALTLTATEIGWTFLDRNLWGKGYNGSMKSLLIDYVHRELGHDVVFLVYTGNIRSQKAVQKLGAEVITDTEHVLYPEAKDKLAFLLPTQHRPPR